MIDAATFGPRSNKRGPKRLGDDANAHINEHPLQKGTWKEYNSFHLRAVVNPPLGNKSLHQSNRIVLPLKGWGWISPAREDAGLKPPPPPPLSPPPLGTDGRRPIREQSPFQR